MDVSMTLPTMVPHDRDSTLQWCRDTDAGPWASLAVPERVTYPSHDITVELAAAAALTERVRLWSTIVILPAARCGRGREADGIGRRPFGRATHRGCRSRWP